MSIGMKNKLLTLALPGAMLFSGVAFAGYLDCDPRFYLGAEAQAHAYKNKKTVTANGITFPFFGDGGVGATGFIGLRLNQPLGLELGYTDMSSSTQTISIQSPAGSFSSQYLEQA